MSVSPPPGPASGRSPIGETTWKLLPPSVERCTNEFCVVVPHGPDSHQVPSGWRNASGSPSVRCASTIVEGPKTAFQLVRDGTGLIPFDPPSDPGGIGTGADELEKRPSTVYGAVKGPAGADDGHAWAEYTPPSLVL